MTTQQPEALRLADELSKSHLNHHINHAAAAELRRLHESNTDLLAALQALVKTDAPDQIKSSIWKQAFVAINKAEGEAK